MAKNKLNLTTNDESTFKRKKKSHKRPKSASKPLQVCNLKSIHVRYVGTDYNTLKMQYNDSLLAKLQFERNLEKEREKKLLTCENEWTRKVLSEFFQREREKSSVEIIEMNEMIKRNLARVQGGYFN